MPRIKVGYEVGTGREVWIPDDRHIGITGQTQRSGKTTTLEALISRAQGCALAFITKRGEGSFRKAQKIPAFFYDPLADKNPQLEPWQFMISVLEAKLGYKMPSQIRRIIIKTCQAHKGKDAAGSWPHPRSLSQVVENVQIARSQITARVESETYMELAAFMDAALPEIQSINPLSDPEKNKLLLGKGLNVMDLHQYSEATQQMVIAACLWDIHKHRKNTKVIIPECQKFLPQKGKGEPPSLVSKIGEDIIRQGAGIGNLILLDTQDMRGVDKTYVGGCGVFFFGVQREQNEIGRMLKSIPNLGVRIRATDIMLLKKGHFLVQYDDKLFHTYIQPVDVGDEHAHSIAIGDIEVESVAEIWAEKDKNKKVDAPEELIEQGVPYSVPKIFQGGDSLEPIAESEKPQTVQEQLDTLGELYVDLLAQHGKLSQDYSALTQSHARTVDELNSMKSKQPKTENGIRTDVRTRIPEGERAPLLDPFPGAIPSLDDADAQGREGEAVSVSTMTPAPTETKNIQWFIKCLICKLRFLDVETIAQRKAFMQRHNDAVHIGEELNFTTVPDVAAPETAPSLSMPDPAAKDPGYIGIMVSTKENPEWHPVSADVLYQHFRQRAFNEQPCIMELFAQRPELRLNIERPKIEVDANTLQGHVALLIRDGFFAAPRPGPQVQKEIERRGGGKQPTTNLYRACDKLAEMGFLTKESEGYLAVPGIKI